MDKSANTPIIYDFFSKSLKEIAFSRKNQASDHNFKGIPAVIVGVSDYEEYQCVDVKVSINDIYTERDNLVLESITLKRRFVSLPSSGGFSIKQPVAIGNPVRLKWSHRDLGVYLDGDGSNVDINISEIAGIEDCWVELDGGTRKNNTSPSLTDFIIEGPKTKITIKPSGETSLVTNGTTITIDSSGNLSVVTNGTSSIEASGHTINAPTTINGDTLINGILTLPTGIVNTHVHLSTAVGTPVGPMQ